MDTIIDCNYIASGTRYYLPRAGNTIPRKRIERRDARAVQTATEEKLETPGSNNGDVNRSLSRDHGKWRTAHGETGV